MDSSLSFIPEWLNKMQFVHDSLLAFFENNESNKNNYYFDDFISKIEENKIRQNSYDFKALLHLISKISDNQKSI